MREKIEKLLDEKRMSRTILLKEWSDEDYLTSSEQENYTYECDKLETEIALLKFILKD